jgi:hypothetical protein
VKLVTLAKQRCEDSHCPTVYRTERQTLLICGRLLPSNESLPALAAGEALVEVPCELIAEVAALL